MMMHASVCIVMCKAPELGRVKTRLAAEIGDTHALRVYEALLGITLHAATSSTWNTVLAVDGDHSRMPVHPHRIIPQCGDELGVRICNAINDAGDYERIVVIGADAPRVTHHHIARAFHALDTHDVVLGPAADGGYWLIGMRQLHPDLFADIPWSTDRVLTRTRERCEQHARTVALLETLSDIDVRADLERHPEFVYE